MSHKLDELSYYLDRLANKVKKDLPLNFWDKKILSLQKSEQLGYSSPQWVREKIIDILRERKAFIEKKRKGNTRAI